MSYSRDERGALMKRAYALFPPQMSKDPNESAKLGRFAHQARNLGGITRTWEEVVTVLSEDETGEIVYGAQRTLTAGELEEHYQAALARTRPPARKSALQTGAAPERNTRPLPSLHASVIGTLATEAKQLATRERKATLGELANDAYNDGYTWKEIATALGLSINSTKKYAATHEEATGWQEAEITERDAAIYDMRLRALNDDSDLQAEIAHYARMRALRKPRTTPTPTMEATT